ncbi:MAG: thioredoxin family protein [Candidatus Tectomicrobia bacterium]|uniref:Thioredoxin family protein n=1 Tax=Tectimicrobiota bacterium TaxID=2528274 RepID=A0A933GKM7_UNCTE|nr:thioredoxin family protein [Candidatus Tectomicrobia bacterium]
MSDEKIREVITETRYYKGLTYLSCLAKTGENKERFLEMEATFKLSAEDAKAFKNIVKSHGALKVLAIVEDWSPDVHRALPVLYKLVEAGGMELRIFARDQNPDIMDLFLNKGQFRSIPTFVFLTPDLKYLCHWIERPAVAVKLFEEIDAELAPKNLPIEERRKIRRERSRSLWPQWQQEIVREIKDLLSLPQSSEHII